MNCKNCGLPIRPDATFPNLYTHFTAGHYMSCTAASGTSFPEGTLAEPEGAPLSDYDLMTALQDATVILSTASAAAANGTGAVYAKINHAKDRLNDQMRRLLADEVCQ